ncbi:bi-functional coumaroyl CoA and feruloyl CoA ortho-hydroxylase F6H2-1-1-like isoform X1 [Tripterygium wilfordii]|uniref:bi-functional coumaroyl CoA and feruloyl CoA ortho-hydroxylase F6H2-1-1-like isoform X1 n=1 Tax=Tripterygium wilfordii TaxID=458696 RepID=UPI0018F83129|nr:bi-functional coumaroyl CoA and feruloyl CoA ortho-hydroxylase F6H2-1-1-like isoform X1 [Tripterygium wilfordii]
MVLSSIPNTICAEEWYFPLVIIFFPQWLVSSLMKIVGHGLETLPQQYVQPPEERLDVSELVSKESLPTIDVSNWDDPEVAKSICEAASKWGFFQIINHGLPIELLESMKSAVHGFFGLPNEERRKYWKGQSVSNTVFLTTSFSPQSEKVLEWKDSLNFHYKPGDNESSASWPPVCKDQVLDYIKRAEFIIKRLLQVLLKSLDVEEIDKAKEYALMGSVFVNLNYYPHCLNPELTAGIGRHADLSTITLLLQDDIGGLYVRAPEGNGWIHVSPIDGALVVNIGDALQIMSNDRYRSVEHRAIPSRSRNRVSIPIFANPGLDASIGPLPEVLASGEKPIYRQLIYGDYLRYYLAKGHEGKKTIDFAKKG